MRNAYPLVWHWRKWPRPSWTEPGSRKGERCRVVVRAKRMNSVLIEFQRDGHRVVTSANGLRKVPAE